MDQPRTRRRGTVGTVIGLSALAGLTAATLGVVGIAQHDGVAVQQRDVALTAVGDHAVDPAAYGAAEQAHAALLTAQAAQNTSFFDQQVVGMQESLYYWTQDHASWGWLFSDDSNPFSLFNGAWTRFSEAQLVSQAIHQVKLDHLLGVNQTFGEGGYESQIADSLYGNISGSGIDPGSTLGDALNQLTDPDVQVSYSGFTDALGDLHGALLHTAWMDVLGIFFGGGADV